MLTGSLVRKSADSSSLPLGPNRHAQDHGYDLLLLPYLGYEPDRILQRWAESQLSIGLLLPLDSVSGITGFPDRTITTLHVNLYISADFLQK